MGMFLNTKGYLTPLDKFSLRSESLLKSIVSRLSSVGREFIFVYRKPWTLSPRMKVTKRSVF